jgi:hypothetical protein
MCLSTEPQSPPKTDLVTSKPTFTPGQKVVVDDALGAYGLKRGQVLTVKQQDEDGDLSFEETGGGWYSYRRFSAQTHAPAPASAKSVIPDYILARLTPGSKVYAKVYRYGQGIHADREYELANVDAATGKVNLAGVEHRLNWTDIHPMFVVGDAIKLVKNLRGNTIGLTGTVQEVTIEGFNSSAKVELSNGQIQTGFLSYFELDAEKQTPPKPEIEIFPAVTAVQVSMDKLGRNPMNSGKTFTFKRGTDPVTGKPGWQVQEIPGFHPVPSLMVPHDLIEHEPGSASTPEEEFKAIGTALYLRGETGFFPTNGLGNFTDAMIAGAIEPLFFHVLNGNAPDQPLPVGALRLPAPAQRPVRADADPVRRQGRGGSAGQVRQRPHQGGHHRVQHGLLHRVGSDRLPPCRQAVPGRGPEAPRRQLRPALEAGRHLPRHRPGRGCADRDVEA